jgi:ABC-2 type transport system permease protein
MALAFVLLVVAMTTLAAAFAGYAGATAGVAQTAAARPFRWSRHYATSPAQALRHKEWMLLLRDPWLVSQSLMQILYLLPPALFLWRSFHAGIGALVVITPVLVMAAGQLSGGLAWLAVSGEDAPELIATAPITTTAVSHAKIEAIIGCIALVFAPFILALTAVSPFYALIAALGIAMAGTAAVVIQFSFRSQAKRSHFRRRQTSSRLATFAEAFASIAVAATSALAASGSGYALVTAVISVGIVVGAWMISPAHTAAGRPATPRLPSKTLAVAG